MISFACAKGVKGSGKNTGIPHGRKLVRESAGGFFVQARVTGHRDRSRR